MSEKDRIEALGDRHRKTAIINECPVSLHTPLHGIYRDFERIFPMRSTDYEPAASSSIAAQARSRGIAPAELFYDLMLEDEGNSLFIATLTNYSQCNLDAVRQMITHPDTVVALGDGGAHYGFICDASFPTHLLSYWTRDRPRDLIGLPLAIQMLTSSPARLAGFRDRGRIAAGYKADINVIDYDNLTLDLPKIKYDLPGGGKRIDQASRGYRATIVGGQMIVENDTYTEALPGRLIRCG